jgi:phosphomannomutase
LQPNFKVFGVTLIASISGIRGTIGGDPGSSLTPLDIVRFTAGYGTWIRKKKGKKVVIGRDARPSGEMVSQLVSSTLNSLGIDVIDLDLATTPTVEMAVLFEKASGGIVLTASHNPIEWNALKLLNNRGEFISGAEGEEILRYAAAEKFEFVPVARLGSYSRKRHYLDKHIKAILKHPLVDVKAIKKARYRIAVDAVNSVGGIAVPRLLKALGVKKIEKVNCKPNGQFAHNPEPLTENLKELIETIRQGRFDLGIAVDPDVDRLAVICEDGVPFGEEYTLVTVADYVLASRKGNTVSNLSSTRALKEVTEKAGGSYFASAVGEVNVVAEMKRVKAVIGGEGNGGVIVPDLHYGRDALIGIALFLSHLAKEEVTASILRAKYPDYVISKNKIELKPGLNIDKILEGVRKKHPGHPMNRTDGLKIEFDREWVHLRKSNTEPIIRIYAESISEASAQKLARQIMKDIEELAALQSK